MMDFGGLKIEKNQQIIVKSTKGKFYGKFNKLSVNGSRIDLFNVKGETGKACGAFKYFYNEDVIAVSVVGEETSGSESTVVELPPKDCQLTQQQLKMITQSISNFTYIQQADAKYFEALEDISKEFVIGVSVDYCSR